MISCEHCDKPFEPFNQNHKLCSYDCRESVKNARRKVGKQKPRGKPTMPYCCRVCGGHFSSASWRTICDNCKLEHSGIRQVIEPSYCLMCGTYFEKMYGRQIYCSKQCKEKFRECSVEKKEILRRLHEKVLTDLLKKHVTDIWDFIENFEEIYAEAY